MEKYYLVNISGKLKIAKRENNELRFLNGKKVPQETLFNMVIPLGEVYLSWGGMITRITSVNEADGIVSTVDYIEDIRGKREWHCCLLKYVDKYHWKGRWWDYRKGRRWEG